ncbi:shikimate kinase [candidate division KSB1 bacterium]|nr:shikimate kinase [candidate division KSB1 bacterium]
MLKNIYLIGFMGCGKSTVGRALAIALGRQFIDTDIIIEQQNGMTIPQIFLNYGETHFRALEKACIDTIAGQNNYVVALGGGSILDPENWNRISQSGLTIALDYPVSVLYERLKNDTYRPLLSGTTEEKINAIQTLLEQRQKYYRQAEFFLQLAGSERIDDIVLTITAFIEGNK